MLALKFSGYLLIWKLTYLSLQIEAYFLPAAKFILFILPSLISNATKQIYIFM